jgi:uncharacterized integral membrane protein
MRLHVNSDYTTLLTKVSFNPSKPSGYFIRVYDMIYLSTAIGLTPGGSSALHIYTQTIHRTAQITTEQHK